MIMSRREVDADLVPLIPEYVNRRRQDIATLRTLVEDESYAEIKRLAHKIKGTGTAYGFPMVTDLAKQIENACATEDARLVRDLIHAMEESLDQT